MTSWQWLSHNHGSLLRWGRIFGSLVLTQVLVQLLNALSGFLLVRSLPKPDYAWFTVASGMSSALAVLSDAGIGSAVTAIGGEVWEDQASLRALVRAALQMRLRMAVAASVVVAVISIWLLRRTGADWPSSCMLTALVLSPSWCLSTSSVLCVVNRLRSRTRELQKAEIQPALLRTVVTGALAIAGWLTPVTAILAVLAGHVWQWRIVSSQVLPLLGEELFSGELTAKHGLRIRLFIHQLLPNCVFSCVQGQLTTWLVSLHATTSEVADLGALNRIGILFAVIGGPVTQFVAPAFARAVEKKRLWIIAGGLVAGSMCFGGALLLMSWLHGEWLLWLLGSQYAHLRHELVLVLLGASMTSLSSLLWVINAARGWVRLAWLNIPLTLIVQILYAAMDDLGTVASIAKFVIVTTFAQLLLVLTVTINGLVHAAATRETTAKVSN